MKSTKLWVLACAGAAVLTATVTGPAAAQRAAQRAAERDAEEVAQAAELERQQASERERALAEEQRRAQELERADRELTNRQRELASRERELAQARSELERSRREMEAAARRIAQLSVTQVAPFGEAYVRNLRQRARAYIGATINGTDAGARVMAVTPGSPAAEAGMRTGDVIVAVNGIDVTESDLGPPAAVMDALGQIEPGATASIEILRDGERQTIDVETSENAPFVWFGNLRNGQDAAGNAFRLFAEYPNLPGFFATRWRDMELVELSEGLGEYFGTDEGLLVVHAPANDDIGLRDGDVILEIGGRTPTSPEHAMRILTSFAPGETLELGIMRRQRRETLSYEIPTPNP